MFVLLARKVRKVPLTIIGLHESNAVSWVPWSALSMQTFHCGHQCASETFSQAVPIEQLHTLLLFMLLGYKGEGIFPAPQFPFNYRILWHETPKKRECNGRMWSMQISKNSKLLASYWQVTSLSPSSVCPSSFLLWVTPNKCPDHLKMSFSILGKP